MTNECRKVRGKKQNRGPFLVFREEMGGILRQVCRELRAILQIKTEKPFKLFLNAPLREAGASRQKGDFTSENKVPRRTFKKNKKKFDHSGTIFIVWRTSAEASRY